MGRTVSDGADESCAQKCDVRGGMQTRLVQVDGPSILLKIVDEANSNLLDSRGISTHDCDTVDVGPNSILVILSVIIHS